MLHLYVNLGQETQMHHEAKVEVDWWRETYQSAATDQSMHVHWWAVVDMHVEAMQQGRGAPLVKKVIPHLGPFSGSENCPSRVSCTSGPRVRAGGLASATPPGPH